MRRGQPLEPVEQRRTQLVQPRERELHLGLDADRVEHPAARRPLGHVLQQRRLADARLAAQHERLALARADGAHQQIERRALALPAEEPEPGIGSRHGRFPPYLDPRAGAKDRPVFFTGATRARRAHA